MKKTVTLAIDTSCDETSCSVVEGIQILSNIQPSQIQFHKQYGGVVPSVARLAHEERIDGVVEEAMKKSKKDWSNVDLIAVTIGPGLSIALEVGIKKAKQLAVMHNKPLMAVNHMEGHLLSVFANQEEDSVKSKSLGILVSGKHTEFVYVKDIGEYEVIGETQDDACGEAFDKCGRMLGLGYPAGPVIAEFSKQHRKDVKIWDEKHNLSYTVNLRNNKSKATYSLPVPMWNSHDYNFSYSGLKTAFRQLTNSLIEGEISVEDELAQKTNGLTKEQILDLSVLFEETAFRPIEIKLSKIIEQYALNEVWLGGGVAANVELRKKLRRILKPHTINLRLPYSKKLTTDNAAMIGVAANMNVSAHGGFDEVMTNYENMQKIGIFRDNFDHIDRDPTLQF